MLKLPQDRSEILRPVVKNMGGDLVASWVCNGDYDLIVIMHLPDGRTALAAAMALKAGGGVKEVKTTRLFSWHEAMQAMQGARRSGYRPPTEETDVNVNQEPETTQPQEMYRHTDQSAKRTY